MNIHVERKSQISILTLSNFSAIIVIAEIMDSTTFHQQPLKFGQKATI